MVYPVSQDNGKAEVVNTFIKAKPLFTGGNSLGDSEMRKTSVGLKLIVNPDDQKIEKERDNKTVKPVSYTHLFQTGLIWMKRVIRFLI